MTGLARTRSAVVDLIDAVLEVSVAGGFSRLGYAARSRLLPEFGPKAFPSLAGRTVLITGATSGIGLAAASRLAGLGATVSFLARSRDRAERARSRIAAAAASADHDPDSAGYGLADLDDLDSVRDFAAWFGATHSRLDVLVHNAGAIHPRQQHSPAGLELTAAGQLVAPFLLTHLLLGELRRSAPSRVITVSSGGMYTQRLDLTGLEPAEADYSGVTAYARVKRAQVALSSQWALRTAGSGIAFHAMHPGWVRTPGISQALPRFSRLMGPLLRTPDQGADTLVWLASTDPDQLGSGQFWHDRRPRPVYRFLGAQPGPPDAADQLWDWVATQAGIDPGAAARQDQAAGRAAGRGLPG